MAGSLDDSNPKLLDARDYALIITVDLKGVVDVQSRRCSKRDAVVILRDRKSVV